MNIPRSKPKDILLLVATIAAIGFFAAWQLTGLQANRADSRVRVLRTELLAVRLDSAQWATRLVESTEGLEERLQFSRDSTVLLSSEKADLAREVEALGGRILVLADMYAEARGQLEAAATTHESVGNTTEIITDSITAPFDDGLLRGRVAYFPAPSHFSVQYTAHIALALGMIDTPDGRMLLSARAPDSRVALSYGEVLFQRPEPIRVCSLGQKAGAGLKVYGALRTLELAIGAIRGR